MVSKSIILFGSSLAIGGAERSLVSMANFLAAKPNILVTVVTIKGGVLANDFLPAVKHVIIGNRLRALVKLLLRRRWTADIAINYHDWSYYTSWFVHQVKAKRKLLWIHNQRNKILNVIGRFFYRYVGKRNRCQPVAVSLIVARSHAAIFKVDPATVTVIGNLIATDYQNHFSGRVIVNIARGAAIKNHPLMISILQALAPMAPDVKFLQFGVTPGSSYANAYAAGLKNLPLKWELRGAVENPWSEIKGALLVMTSFIEGQPLVIMEAISHQLKAAVSIENSISLPEFKAELIPLNLHRNPQEIAEQILNNLDTPADSGPTKVRAYQKAQVLALKKLFSI